MEIVSQWSGAVFRWFLCLAALLIVVHVSTWSLGFLGEYRDYLLALAVALLLQPLIVDKGD